MNAFPTAREALSHGKFFATVMPVVWSKAGQRTFYHITAESGTPSQADEGDFPSRRYPLQSSRDSLSISSLPILGNRFKSEELDRNNTVLVVLLTPQVNTMLAMPRDFLTPLTPNGTAGPISEQVEGNTEIQVTKARTAI